MRKGFFEEYVPVNGIDMYLLHYPAAADKPVLLYLHGGPGESCACFAYLLRDGLMDVCSFVNWDQRGAGRTLLKNPHAVPDTETMLEDLHGVIAHLKERYGKPCIALLGHSWGSVLGSLYAKRHPEDLACYIGVGQVVGMRENEEAGYGELCRRIQEAGSDRDKRLLAEIGEYPGADMDEALATKLIRVRKLQRRYGLAMKVDAALLSKMFKSPVFRPCDLRAMAAGEKLAAVHLDAELAAYDIKQFDARYQTPVYYVLGDRDWQTPYPVAAAYLDTVDAPDKRLYMIRDAGHVTPVDQPEQFCAALRDIFSRLDAAGLGGKL